MSDLARGAFVNSSYYNDGSKTGQEQLLLIIMGFKNLNVIYLSSDLDIAKRTHVALEEITNVTSLLDFKHDMKKITKCT